MPKFRKKPKHVPVRGDTARIQTLPSCSCDREAESLGGSCCAGATAKPESNYLLHGGAPPHRCLYGQSPKTPHAFLRNRHSGGFRRRKLPAPPYEGHHDTSWLVSIYACACGGIAGPYFQDAALVFEGQSSADHPLRGGIVCSKRISHRGGCGPSQKQTRPELCRIGGTASLVVQSSGMPLAVYRKNMFVL